MKIEVLPDDDGVARKAAAIIAAEVRAAVPARGRFVMAVSGGHTPWQMLRALAGEPLPWESVHVVQVDERVAPAGDPDRNLVHLRESLLEHAPLRPEQIHAMPVEAADLERAAEQYAQTLRELAGSPPVLDLVHLGLGPDGHTASLVPGDPVLDVTDADVAVTGPYQDRRRMTLTYPVINRSRRVLVAGDRRREGRMLRAPARRRSDQSRRRTCVRIGRWSLPIARRQSGSVSNKNIGGAGMSATRQRCRGSADDERPAGPVVDQHHSHPVDRRGPAGEVRPSGHADGAGAAGLHDLEPGDALRSAGSDLAEPRSLRAVERSRIDAAVVGAASDRHARRERRVRTARASRPSRSTTSATSASSAARRRVIPSIIWSRVSKPRPARSGRASPPASAWRSREKWLAARYNRPGFEIFDYNIYAVCGDGDMMEGVASEAASLAGHLALDNLCWIYDNNHITIEGNTRITFTEDIAARFLAYGWNVLRVGDANDIERIEQALDVFRKTKGRPTFIILDSHIGYGSPHKQDTAAAHGEPLGEEEVRLTKRDYGWPEDAKFLVPDGVREHFAAGIGARGAQARRSWTELFAAYRTKYPELATEIDLMQRRELPAGWDRDLPVFPADPKGIAGREASGKVLNVLAQNIPWLLGGSADLGPSNKTTLTVRRRRRFRAGQPRRQEPAFRHSRTCDGGRRSTGSRSPSCGPSAPRSSSSATTRGRPSGCRR